MDFPRPPPRRAFLFWRRQSHAGSFRRKDGTDVVEVAKEAVSPTWHREDQVLRQRPTLLIIHRSAFSHQPGILDRSERTRAESEVTQLGLENPYDLGWSKLVHLLGYIGLGSPKTRFIVYSRGFDTEAERSRWMNDTVLRFPHLQDRITLFNVPRDPNGHSSFRDPATREAFRVLVESALDS